MRARFCCLVTFLTFGLLGLMSSVSVSADPLIEGRVRLDSGEPVAEAQVRIFDLTDLRRGAVARAMTDEKGYFALPLAALAGSVLPEGFTLGQNYPNPFNPSTIIPYQLAASAPVRLEVFNLLGQRIATLVDGERPAGFHAATWHATDAAGRAVGAGVYIYRMTAGAASQTGRMVLIDGQAGVSAAGAASFLPASSSDVQTYQLTVSGDGLVPYTDPAFRVRADMAPVELVVSSSPGPAGKATDVSVCDRTSQVRDEIVRQTGRADCASVTNQDLAKLTELNLRGKEITALKAGDFAGLDRLGALFLDVNPLSELPANVFSGLDNLYLLLIGHTELTALPDDVFSNLTNLQDLSLYSNRQLTALPSDVFAGLTNLRKLGLDQNGLTALPVGVFDDLANLRELWLRGNQLTRLPAGIFSDLTNLETLLFKDNPLSELPTGVFSGLPRLAQLSLGNNKLTSLPAGVFAGLTNLSTLDLFGNPGAPFALTLELERTDTSNLLASGPADVAVRVREGAPFEIAVELLVVNGSASDSSFTIRAGDTKSAPASITAADTMATHVGWGLTGQVPGGFTGVKVGTGSPLALFAESDKHWPVAEGNIPPHILQVGGPQPELDVKEYFSDPDGIEGMSLMTLFSQGDGAKLTYSVKSMNDTLVRARVRENAITFIPRAEGATSVIVKATDEDGLSALQDIPVTILPAPDPSSFDIDLVFITPATEGIRSTTRRMSKRWTEVITGDLPDVSLSGVSVDCEGRVPERRFFGNVDDLMVFVEIAPVVGGKGFGGPCGKRDGSFLPYMGRFVLDSEEAGSFDGGEYTIFHELGHVLGIGTLWKDLGLIQGGDTENPYFTGPLAIEAFNKAGGTNYTGPKVPVSWDLGHWSGNAFGWDNPRELMMEGGGTILSAITIQSLADVGYVVDISQAEPFRLTGSAKAVAAKAIDQRYLPGADLRD